jgi:putative SOS response-associated peptidase YedK
MEVYASMFDVASAFTFKPSYNVAPSQAVLACRAAEMGWRELVPLRWGLVPHWAKEPKTGYSMTNARAETVAVKPAYRSAFRKRRCLIPADGFYEWKPGKPRKQPYYIHRQDNQPFAFAGLWEHWEKDRKVIDTCTIVVTAANELIGAIHDRMPVILPPESYDLWLDPVVQDADKLLPLLKPYPVKELEAYPVSTKVNAPVNNGAELIERVGG